MRDGLKIIGLTVSGKDYFKNRSSQCKESKLEGNTLKCSRSLSLGNGIMNYFHFLLFYAFSKSSTMIYCFYTEHSKKKKMNDLG
jgi:hypothetical protein